MSCGRDSDEDDRERNERHIQRGRGYSREQFSETVEEEGERVEHLVCNHSMPGLDLAIIASAPSHTYI